MFTTLCFIRKNTPGLRKKLDDLGRKCADELRFVDNEGSLTCFTSLDGCGYYDLFFNYENLKDIYVDCGTDEDLFLALAALRDDSDYMQWFINYDYDMYQRDLGENCFEMICCDGEKFNRTIWNSNWRKATPAELIEYFKKTM